MTKKDILSHTHTDLTCVHHIIEQHKKHHTTMADLSPSTNGSPVVEAVATHILLTVIPPSTTALFLHASRIFL